jgi:hypothetical protein
MEGGEQTMAEATADPYGMTNKRTGKSNSKRKNTGVSNCGGKSAPSPMMDYVLEAARKRTELQGKRSCKGKPEQGGQKKVKERRQQQGSQNQFR